MVDRRQKPEKERTDFREGRIWSPRTPRKVDLKKPDVIGRMVKKPEPRKNVE